MVNSDLVGNVLGVDDGFGFPPKNAPAGFALLIPSIDEDRTRKFFEDLGDRLQKVWKQVRHVEENLVTKIERHKPDAAFNVVDARSAMEIDRELAGLAEV